MTKKWLLLIPAGIILSACNSAAPTTSVPQSQAAPTAVVGAPTPSVKAAMSYAPADLSDQQLDKDMAAADKELSSLEKDSTGVDLSFNDTPIDVNK